MWISIGVKQLRIGSSSLNTVMNLHLSQRNGISSLYVQLSASGGLYSKNLKKQHKTLHMLREPRKITICWCEYAFFI
jgi:hypothetical protein